MINKELRRAIINWLLDNENQWQRVNACVEWFGEYIYNSKGNFLIGGKEVHDFICAADKSLYGKSS